MARVDFNPETEEILGKLSGGVFQDSYFGMQVRGWAAPRNPETQLSQLRRGNFRFLSSAWRALDSIDRLSWFDAAGTTPAALRLYIGSNINRLLIGEEITAHYNASDIPSTFPVVVTGISDSSILFTASTSVATVPLGTKLLLYATTGKEPTKLFSNPSEFQPITFFEAGTVISAPIDVFTFWFEKYGFLTVNKLVCLKSVLINSSSGTRGAESIACAISTSIMTLQQAFNESVLANNNPQILYNTDGAKTRISFEFASGNGQTRCTLNIALSGIELSCSNKTTGEYSDFLVQPDGAISFNSSTSFYQYTNMVAAASDSDAAAAGVPVSGLYQNNGAVQIRLT